jgi:DNA-binding winged helix-turn-helix (wHTH) protein
MHYRFRDFILDTQRDELRPGKAGRLDRQVWAVLAYLLQHHDRIVPRQELSEQRWPERFVSDAALAQVA